MNGAFSSSRTSETMSSAGRVRELVNERLTVAAEEIFAVFQRAIVEYEEEIYRQRKLLEVVWNPSITLHKLELPEHQAGIEEDVPTEQQRASNPDHEEPKPPQIKEETEELCASQEDLMLTPVYDESDQRDDLSLNLNIDEIQAAIEEKPLSYILAESPVGAELPDNHQLLPHSSLEAGSKHGDTRPNRGAASRQHRDGKSHSSNALHPSLPKIHRRTVSVKQPIKCDICGKSFKFLSQFSIHRRSHTGEKPYSCNTCGKGFCYTSGLNTHVKIHTGERPFVCSTCGRGFIQRASLTAHKRIHTGEKPFPCKTCGKCFRFHSGLLIHAKTHAGDKSFTCRTCGKVFPGMAFLKRHKNSCGWKPSCLQNTGDFVPT